MKFCSVFNFYVINQWSSSAGWENQEVAPRCELDRNQYLETGQFIESTEVEEVPLETETNEEGNLCLVKIVFTVYLNFLSLSTLSTDICYNPFTVQTLLTETKGVRGIWDSQNFGLKHILKVCETSMENLKKCIITLTFT